MVAQTHEIKLRDLGYFKFELKMLNKVKTGVAPVFFLVTMV